MVETRNISDSRNESSWENVPLRIHGEALVVWDGAIHGEALVVWDGATFLLELYFFAYIKGTF